MERTFKLSVPSETRTIYPDRDGRADVTYTATNSKTVPVRGGTHVVAKDSTKNEWLSVAGGTERDFSGGESQQFKVTVSIPKTTPAGTYGLRLDVANVANPQEDFTEGDTVVVDWKPVIEKKKPLPRWLWPVVAAALLIVGVAMFLVLRPRGVPMPNLVGKDSSEAGDELTKVGLKVGAVTMVRNGDAPAASVLEQKPQAGARVKPGDSVDLVVQDIKPLIVPAVTGGPADAAKTRLKDAGFKVTVVTAREGGAAPGTVLRQDPPANTSVKPESIVTMTVQANPEAPKMIRVVSRTLDDAEKRLSQLNIAYTVLPVAADPTRVGTITSQSIDEDAPVPPGVAVKLGVGANVVPSLIGNTLAAAVQALQQNGLQVGNVSGSNQFSVVGQSIAANTPVMPGTKVDVQFPGIIIAPYSWSQISRNPLFVPVPPPSK